MKKMISFLRLAFLLTKFYKRYMSLFEQQWHEGRVPYFLASSGGSGGSGSFTPGAVAGDLLPTADATYDIGSGALRWQDIFSTSLSTITATLSGNLSAANATLSGALDAASASLSGALTSASVSSGTGTFSGAVDVSGLLRALGGLTISGGVTATSGALSSLAVSGSTSLASVTTSGNLGVGGTLSAASPAFTGTASTAAINNSGTVTTANLTASGQVQTPSIQSTSSIQIGNDIYPSVNNLFSNGTSSNRWAALWAIAGDITTLGVSTLNAANVVVSSGLSVGGTLGVSNINTGNIIASGTAAITGALTSAASVAAPILYGSTGAQIEALASYSGGDVTVSSALVPSGTRNLGSSGSRWSTIYANGLDSNTGLIGSLSSTVATITNLAVPGTVSTPNLYSGSSADILVGSSLVSGVSKNLGSATFPWIYGYVTNLVSSNLSTGPITASTFSGTSATLSGALNAASASLSGALSAASASISGTLSVGSLSISSLSTGAITASSLAASGAVNSATMYTSGLAQHDGGMLGNVRAVGSFSESNTILHYEYNDLEDCTTIRSVRNSHTPRIELGYNGQVIRVSASTMRPSGNADLGTTTYPWNNLHVNRIYYPNLDNTPQIQFVVEGTTPHSGSYDDYLEGSDTAYYYVRSYDTGIPKTWTTYRSTIHSYIDNTTVTRAGVTYINRMSSGADWSAGTKWCLYQGIKNWQLYIEISGSTDANRTFAAYIEASPP